MLSVASRPTAWLGSYAVYAAVHRTAQAALILRVYTSSTPQPAYHAACLPWLTVLDWLAAWLALVLGGWRLEAAWALGSWLAGWLAG